MKKKEKTSVQKKKGKKRNKQFPPYKEKNKTTREKGSSHNPTVNSPTYIIKILSSRKYKGNYQYLVT